MKVKKGGKGIVVKEVDGVKIGILNPEAIPALEKNIKAIMMEDKHIA